jgi:hypothetical protein
MRVMDEDAVKFIMEFYGVSREDACELYRDEIQAYERLRSMMSLREKLIRDMPKLKTALCAADVAKRYSVTVDGALKVLRGMLKDNLITLERAGNTYYYRWNRNGPV